MSGAIRAETGFSLKDRLFNESTAREFAGSVAAVYPEFDEQGFVNQLLARFPALELKQRMDLMTELLGRQLPGDFGRALDILHRALPAPLDPELTDDDFGKFIWMIPGQYVARHGCVADRLQGSLEFLKEATKRGSSEMAVRPFLRDFPGETLAFLRQCAVDKNYHVRRWSSEGIRPFLPWAERVVLPAADILEVLSLLHADSTRYVTRSVANNLNDVSKIDPDAVVAALKEWGQLGSQEPAELDWMTRHALRTVIRTDFAPALDLLGYTTAPSISVTGMSCTEQVRVGGTLEWRCEMVSERRQKLKIGLMVHFMKANGRHAGKLFMVKDRQMEAGESLELVKRLPFKPMTTRVLYPGQHHAELVINGIPFGKRTFQLVA